MKLHLPSLLTVALLGAMTAAAAELTYTTDDNNNKIWTVPTHESIKQNLPSSSSNIVVYNGDFYLSGEDTLGAYSGEKID